MVYIPGLSTRNIQTLERRKGGGRGGGKSSGKTKSTSSSGSSSSKSSKSKTKTTTVKKGSKGKKSSGFALGAGAAGGSIAMNPYSWGGGHSYYRPSNVPFPGRLSGNGTRDQVFGTSRYGSGYPYGNNGFVSARPFPFVFWPVPIAVGYYGADAYADYSDSVRPGGDINVAPIKSTISSTAESYRIVGDRSSVKAVLDALVANCSVASASTSYFAPRSPPSQPATTEFIQWYRASSFGLSLDGYNNLASSPANMTSETTLPPLADVPLPSGLNTTFLQCLNTTIGMAVPLAAPAKKFDGGTIAGIVIGSVIFFIGVCIFVQSMLRKCAWRRHGGGGKKFWRNASIPRAKKQKAPKEKEVVMPDDSSEDTKPESLPGMIMPVPETLPSSMPVPEVDGKPQTLDRTAGAPPSMDCDTKILPLDKEKTRDIPDEKTGSNKKDSLPI